jgi:hypothetical protein
VYKKTKAKTDPFGYWGITVTPVLGKILETIMKNRITPKLKASQNPMQAGFT